MVVSLNFSDYQLPQITKIQKLECTQFLGCISEVKVFHTIHVHPLSFFPYIPDL